VAQCRIEGERFGIRVGTVGIVVEKVDILVERVDILVEVEDEDEETVTAERRRTDLWARVVGMGTPVAVIRKDSVIAARIPLVM